MATLTRIEQDLNVLLGPDKIDDYCPNGVQVCGCEEISRIITGVSGCVALFEEALTHKADLILVHHGIFWNSDSRVVQGSLKRRLQLLLSHDITLMAYHLPLDCHPELGNNSQILKALSLETQEPFGLYRGKHLSHIGRTLDDEPLDAFVARVKEVFGGEPLVLPFGPDKIRRIAVCSGGAPELIREAKAAGADLYLTGEATEHVYHFAREEGIHFIAAGHHRTEKLGVQAVGAWLAERFDVTHQFIDIDNPI